MVDGIGRFREYFEGFEDCYILIGGAASNIIESEGPFVPRRTKDLDIILVVEKMNTNFVKKFWEFIKTAGYEHKQKGSDKSEFYRFLNPKDISFPAQIELLSRKTDMLPIPDDIVIGPIPVDKYLYSLSAIILDEDYYQFTVKNSILIEGIHIANAEALICLKAKAYLNLRKAKDEGKQINSDDIKKHKNDVLRLALMINPDETIDIPESIRNDMEEFIEKVQDELPHDDFLKRINANTTAYEVMNLITDKFVGNPLFYL